MEPWVNKRLISSKDEVQAYTNRRVESCQQDASDGANRECQKHTQKMYLRFRRHC